MQKEPSDPLLDVKIGSFRVALAHARFRQAACLPPKPRRLSPALRGGHLTVDGVLDLGSFQKRF